MSFTTLFTKQLAAASSNAIALSQTPGTAALTLNGAAVTAGVATIDTATAANTAIGRRVIITSGGNDSGITWTVVGTNSNGSQITDTFAGSSGGAAQSNLDFVTVSSIKPSGSVATTALAGTNGIGSSPWWLVNTSLTPVNVSAAVELVSGAANFTIQYTYDDPNNLLGGILFPLEFDSTTVFQMAVTADGGFSMPIAALRLLVNSGTGALRIRYLQAGIG